MIGEERKEDKGPCLLCNENEESHMEAEYCAICYNKKHVHEMIHMECENENPHKNCQECIDNTISY